MQIFFERTSANFHIIQYITNIDQITGKIHSINKPFFQFIFTTKPFNFNSRANV